MQKLFTLLGALLVLASCSPEPTRKQAADAQPPLQERAADLVILSARIYTLNWPDPSPGGTLSAAAPHDAGGWRPDARALALRDGLIVYVGDNEGAIELRNGDTRVIDAAGATLVPGLVDSHTHVFNLGASLSRVSLYDVKTEEEAA